ncbi:glycosyltransferase 1 domain-containing protein 1-like [Plakobranchus ocellatus]|uniref:Glycosyltransferase 1 domain-containing protein 1-like n=1 Tax=Plakobranchus ocellatus TaxID=259542 RepID=A0AAV4A2L5_9GAST|nr:glycosyltransferase 1 domain-containing protein 1-like [Plakobranchus ocellatus]
MLTKVVIFITLISAISNNLSVSYLFNNLSAISNNLSIVSVSDLFNNLSAISNNLSDCYFKDATCNKCHKKGHIQSASKSGRNKPTPNNHSSRRKIHELDEQFTLELFQLGERSPKILVPLKVEGTKIDMELDTGAAVTAMTKADFMRIFKSEPQLQKTSIKLKTYTNEVITPLGQLQVKVEKGTETFYLPLLILDK